MKFIKKGKEPHSLITHRQWSQATYKNLPSKGNDELKDSLLKEQKYICCYCMSRISRDKMRVEHWKSQDDFPESDLDYSNLLGACTGNEGTNATHCDVYRGNVPLKINPTEAKCEQQIKFKFVSGEIDSTDNDIKKDINETLKLNHDHLIKKRQVTFDEWIIRFRTKHSKGTWTKAILQNELDKWENNNLAEYHPYCQVVIAYLKNEITKRWG